MSVETKKEATKKEEKQEKNEEKEEGEASKDSLSSESTFEIKIAPPNIEAFSIQVSSVELVQELHQLLLEREDTCHRTCFSLQLDNVSLDNFAELKSIENLKANSVLRVVEEPYSVREARIHVRHVRDLLKSADLQDAYNGQEGASLAFLPTICSDNNLYNNKRGTGNNNNNNGKYDVTSGIDCTPPEYILPGAENANVQQLPLTTLHSSMNNFNSQLNCLKILTPSGWNPPPGPRKLHGDLLYIVVVTLEEKRFHITGCTRGFFVNESTDTHFDPSLNSTYPLTHSLIDLLNLLSPSFKKNLAALHKRRNNRHPFERVATPYQVYTWLSPKLDHHVDAIRAEDAFSSKLGYEEHIPGQTRDWNEELQTTRELPRKSLPERLLRERAVFKVHADFVAAATRGAVAVIDGNVMAINPGEDAKMQMFIWNNIFFSLGFDVRDHYQDLGGDAAAFVAPKNDLQGVKVYNAVDLEGLYTLGTVVVDYRGYRVTAQSIIPGILEREQEQSVVYGSVDFGKTIVTHPKYIDLLQKAGNQLKILPHTVLNDKEEEVLICSSVECKGIIGNDGRHYILDLLRTFPPDVNFLDLASDADVVLSKEAKALGFPVVHAHKLACLRQELIDSFVEARYMMFIKYAAVQLQQLGLKKQMDLFGTDNAPKKITNENDGSKSDTDGPKINSVEEVSSEEKKDEDGSKNVEENAFKNEIDTNGDENKKEENDEVKEHNGDSKAEESKSDSKLDETSSLSSSSKLEEEEAKKMVESLTDSITSGDKREMEESTKAIVKKAAQAVGSLKDTEFDIRFNPDVFSPSVRHASHEDSRTAKQKTLICDASDFLISVQLPLFIRDTLDHSSVPLDGQTLTEALHNRGINVRYMGILATMSSKVSQLSYIHSIASSEVLIRSAKHVMATFLQGLDLTCMAAAISHFLNCLFAVNTNPISYNMGGQTGGGGSRTMKRARGGVAGGRGQRKYQSSLLAVSRSKTFTNAKGEETEWFNLSSSMLWAMLKKEMESYFKFEVNTLNSIDDFCVSFKVHKLALLRSICQKTGICLLMRDYFADPSNNKNSSVFNEWDVLNVFPRAKHINPRASDAYTFYTTGQSKIQQGLLKEGYELMSEALNLLNHVYGAVHPEMAQCLRMLARLNYIMGEASEALNLQQKAVLMSERVNGVDHPYTITEYVHLALYAFANSQISTSLKLLYRARYLCLLVHNANHPEVALIDSNIGLILHAVGEYELALRFLKHALYLSRRFFGEQALKTAVAFHLVARTQSCLGDFRAALANEKETYAIYRAQLGDEHDKTKESSECLKHLTQQAVVLQKKMNELCSGKGVDTAKLGGGGGLLPPIQIQPPSMSSVLDMLNVINGILFVHINQADIDSFKSELGKKQQQQEA